MLVVLIDIIIQYTLCTIGTREVVHMPAEYGIPTHKGIDNHSRTKEWKLLLNMIGLVTESNEYSDL